MLAKVELTYILLSCKTIEVSADSDQVLIMNCYRKEADVLISAQIRATQYGLDLQDIINFL